MVTEEAVRELALRLPEAIESPTWGGDPGFKVRKKLFAHVYPDGRLVVRIDRSEREALMRAQPEKFQCSVPSMPFVEIPMQPLIARS